MNNNYSYNTTFYPLTHPQKRIWYIEKIYPGTSLYNIGGPIRIKGNIDFDILQKVINIFIKRNEALRLQFMEQGSDIKQYVSQYEKIELDFMEIGRAHV